MMAKRKIIVLNHKSFHGHIIDEDCWSHGTAWVNCISFVAFKGHLSFFVYLYAMSVSSVSNISSIISSMRSPNIYLKESQYCAMTEQKTITLVMNSLRNSDCLTTIKT